MTLVRVINVLKAFPGIILFLYITRLHTTAQITEEFSQEMTTIMSTTALPPPPEATTQKTNMPSSVEILTSYVLPGIGNSVKLVWGSDQGPNKDNLTYGVHFGLEEGELQYPKLTTPNQSVIIEDLEYCTKYDFAITILSENGLDNIKINPNTIRTIITGGDQMEAPTNLTVELEARAHPCIDIKWSSACPNVVDPIGYVVSAMDKKTLKYTVVTLPKTKRSDLIYRMPVEYNDSFEIRVSTTFPGSKAASPLTYQVPKPLQPYKVKVTINQEEGAFLIYWAEPFIPLSIGRYYYQVFVYPGQDLEAPYEKYYVTRPVMVYKGERGEYSFSVNFASNDRKHVGDITKPIYANLNGESYELNATFTETPDR
ncbi:uncharacterized protein LOC126736811 [Anthonomus grandis grandis]|uniref:uncharacterized protein LOC126736811 n=1 Tax=Anthonomus grandis grandis TaxID=2921223 RepID=UPI0021661475|nr:uncharacterized protein LOC126736811 [Anthonomus grandis grandis]